MCLKEEANIRLLKERQACLLLRTVSLTCVFCVLWPASCLHVVLWEAWCAYMRGVVFKKNGHTEVFLIVFSHVVQHSLFQCLMFKSYLYLSKQWKDLQSWGKGRNERSRTRNLWWWLYALVLRCHAYAIMKVWDLFCYWKCFLQHKPLRQFSFSNHCFRDPTSLIPSFYDLLHLRISFVALSHVQDMQGPTKLL